MGMTSQGFWYPDPTTNASLQGMFSAAATAADNAQKAGLVRNGVPRATSAANLNALYAATIDPVTNLALVPAIGAQASINSTPVTWDGTNWRAALSTDYIELTALAPVSQNMASSAGTWTTIIMDTDNPVVNNGFVGTPGTNGVLVNPGTYRIEGWYEISASANGYRGIAIATSIQTLSIPIQGPGHTQPGGPGRTSMFFEHTFSPTIPTRYQLRAWHNAGIVIGITNAGLAIQRVL